MDRMLRHRAVPALLMLVMVLGLSLFSVEGTLLCFGSDGHIAIEFVTACGNSSGSQVTETENDACGPCTDLQLQNSASRPSFSAALQNPQLVSAIPIVRAVTIEGESKPFASLREKPPHHTLSALKTVVLLI